MPHRGEQVKTLSQLDELNAFLSSGTMQQVRQMLRTLPAGDIAHLLESSPPATRHVLWQLVEDDDGILVIPRRTSPLMVRARWTGHRRVERELADLAAPLELVEPEGAADR